MPGNRNLLRWFFPRGLEYAGARSLFLRGVGLIYLIAISSWWAQAGALIGEGGLLPVGEFLERVGEFFETEEKSRWWNLPTLFWLGSGDLAITIVCGAGVMLALLVIFGIFPGPCLFGLWLIYLSLFHTGGIFMSYQWDILLLEVGVLAMVLAPWSVARMRWRRPPPLGLGEKLALWLCWLAVAKFMFLSGWVKLAWATPENPEWWPDHSAMTYHYMTQPIPTWTAWWMHQLPDWFQRFSIWPMYFVELVLPFFVFFGARFRLLAAIGFTGLMVLIIATGNYNFFNLLTIVLCIPLVADRFWGWPRRAIRWVFRRPDESGEEDHIMDSVEDSAGDSVEDSAGEGTMAAIRKPLQIAGIVLLFVPLALLIVLNLTVLFNDLHGVSKLGYLEDPALPWTHLNEDLTPEWADELQTSLAPFRIASGYGLFRTMTIDRPEIILEGSLDGSEWREYDVRWKPDELDARPRFVAPHQPRVAWQFWFAALERRFHPRSRNAGWMAALFRGLLKNDPAALSFFNGNPFPDKPPKYLRARLYLYDFTDREDRRESGNWWKRELAGEFLPPISLESFR